MSPDLAIKKLIRTLMDLGQRSNLEGMRQTLADIDTLEQGASPTDGRVSSSSKASASPPTRPCDTD
jgi:hypothetical protein